MAKIVLTTAAQRQILNLPKPIRSRLYGIFDRLAEWPNVSGAKPLVGRLAGHYRIRTGDYRIQFHVADDTVVVDRVGHRDRFYD